MLLNLIQRISLQFKLRQAIVVTSTRSKHRNHPGHKPKPRVVEPKNELLDEYVENPQYPPVKPKYPPGFNFTDYEPKLAWHYYNEGKKFHSLKTIQERLSVMAYLNIQATRDDLGITHMRHYPIYLLNTLPSAAESTKQREYITKTHLETYKFEYFPSGLTEKKIDPEFYDSVKNAVINSILTNLRKKEPNEDLMKNFENRDAYKPESVLFDEQLAKDEQLNASKITDIFDVIASMLAVKEGSDNSHLTTAQYGRNVNIEAYWKRCGYKEAKARGCVQPDPDVIRYQYRDKALYQIKTDMPLKPLLKVNEHENFILKDYNYNPSVYKIFVDHVLPMQVPGHWYGDSREFNYLTVHNVTSLQSTKKKYGAEEMDSALSSMILTSAHAELTAQAYYLGFSMWNDLTYPLFGQFIYTDGNNFSLAKYQLNTIQLWNRNCLLKNSCYRTKFEKLYELSKDGESIEFFNDELLQNIINIMQEKPIKNPNEIVKNFSELDHMIGGTELRPYLSVHDLKQLSKRRQLLATSLYELVKYDRPATYLNIHNNSIPKGEKPKFANLYNKITYQFRDIVREYYPRDYYGYELVKMMLKTTQKYKPSYWDLKEPVYEWASIPPPHTNNIKREINLPKF